MTLVLEGHVVPMADESPTEHFAGRVYIDDAGVIEQVARQGEPAPAGFGSAPVLALGNAYILPGLIDLHSHLAYNMLPLWTEPTQLTPYLHHDIWPNRPTYQPDISWTSWVLVKALPE